jgi:hypothetical protein
MRSAMGHERRFGGKPPLPIYPKQQTLRAAVGRSLKGQEGASAREPTAGVKLSAP